MPTDEFRALLIEVDYRSGRRAGGVNPRDENLQSYGWQSLPNQPGPNVEIRVVEDDRGLSDYEGVEGVTVLRGREEINTAIEENIPPNYDVGEREQVRRWADRRGIDLNNLPNNPYDRKEALFDLDADTVRKTEPRLL